MKSPTFRDFICYFSRAEKGLLCSVVSLIIRIVQHEDTVVDIHFHTHTHILDMTGALGSEKKIKDDPILMPFREQ